MSLYCEALAGCIGLCKPACFGCAHQASGAYSSCYDERRQVGGRAARLRGPVRGDGRMRCGRRWCGGKRTGTGYDRDERYVQPSAGTPTRSRRSYRWRRRLARASRHRRLHHRPQLWVHRSALSWPSATPSHYHQRPAKLCPSRPPPQRWRMTLAAEVCEQSVVVQRYCGPAV